MLSRLYKEGMANKEYKPRHPEIKPRQHETAAECIGDICLSDHLSDISFTFPNSQTKLPAHKLFLSMRSEVFKAMFYGPLAEKHETVTIEDIDIATMENVLRFIYKDKAELDGNNVLACLFAGNKYSLGGLVGRCSEFLETSINHGNVCAIHEQAKFYDIKALQAKCFEYMTICSENVLKSDGILELSNTSLQILLASDNISTDEHDNFVAAHRWAIHQCKTKNLTPDQENLRACLGNMLFEIRFPLMPIDVFASKVASTGILTKDEMLMLYKYHATNSQPTEESPRIGRFSCKDRTGAGASVVWNIANKTSKANRRKHCDESYHLSVHSSARVKILSLRGSFVQHVNNICVNAAYEQNIKFKKTKDDEIIFLDPVVFRPKSGRLELTFHTSSEYSGYKYHSGSWSSCESITKAYRNMNITLTNIPHGLTEIKFSLL